MSPEQARAEAVGSASDVFSLGIVLYELATGRHPFDADTRHGTLHAILTEPAVAPARLNPEIPAALGGLIEAMLHKDARLRPTAAEVEAALARLAGAPARRAASHAMGRSARNGMSHAAVNTHSVRASASAAWRPPGAPFPVIASGTTGAPNRE
jgi:serine/threonine protein kinase